jgi:hypothetical protein
MDDTRADLRRCPRVRVAWKVIVDVPGSRPRMRKTIDVSPFAMKVRFEAPLGDGAAARLKLSTPDRRAFHVNAIVWRSDAEGAVFVFVGVAQEQFQRLKGLLDSYRGAA